MRTSLLSLSLLSTALVACGGDDAPAPSDVRAAITEDLRHVLTEGQAAANTSTASMPSGAVLAFATSALQSSGVTGAMPDRIGEPMTLAALGAIANIGTIGNLGTIGNIDRLDNKDRIPGPKDMKARPGGDEGDADEGDDNEDDGDGDEAGTLDVDALIDTLNSELFTDKNHLGDGVYQVPASLVCGEPVDAECANAVAKAELRVRVAGEDDGLRFFLQVDKDHDEPLGVLLRDDELAITLNLDEAGQAIAALAPVFGDEKPNLALAGEITGSLVIKGKAHAALSVSFDRAISIKLADDGVNLDGENAFRLASAAAEVLAVELDGTAKQGKLDVGLGETTLHVAPADDVDIQATDIFLAGATVNAIYAGNALQLRNLSLGNKTSTISVGGMQGLAIDLNADSGRKLNATIMAQPDGSEMLAVAPRLDLRIVTDHAVLGNERPLYDVTRLQLDGTLKSSPLGNRVEVVGGRFSMTTNPAEFGFSAADGQCVFATEHEDKGASWTQYAVGACSRLPITQADRIDEPVNHAPLVDSGVRTGPLAGHPVADVSDMSDALN